MPLSLPASPSNIGLNCFPCIQSPVYRVALCTVGTQQKPVQKSPEAVVTTSETQRRDAICLGSHSTAVHRQSRPHMELGSGVYLQGYWEGHQLPGLLAWGGPWSVASQGAVSGPQANSTVWERCLLESQVAKLPATKPYWRTERVRYGVCRTCLSSLQLGLQVTPLQGHRQLSLQHTGFATARTEPDTASSWKWLHTEPLLWGTVTSSLS